MVRAVRLRLGSRLPEGFADLPKHRRNFSEGGLRIQLCSGTLATGPMEQQLLTNPLLLTPAAAENRTGWLRLDVAAQHLVLPAQGCFVIAEGTAGPQETFVRRRSLVRPPDGQQPPEDFLFSKHDRPTGKGTRVFRYEELQQADGTLRLAATNLFPALAYLVVAAPSACHSWLRVSTGKQTQIWRAVTEQQASTRQHLPDSTIYDYNYELELEVEEL
ncbi:hypothetical protein [Hymenobacter gelipurpurascens]|nr:hypothetical protein [Hymenobacter gelipurpurascens]